MNAISIYIVDDYLLTRIANKRCFLHDNNFIVEGDFSNARDCIKALEKKEVDVVLMDIELPGINGIEATKIIKEKFPKIKVIILTSFKDVQRVLASLACGACGYIMKNNSGMDLKNIIKMVMKGEFWMDYDVAKPAFSSIPCPDIQNFDIVSESERLKNSLTNRELQVLKLLIDGKTNSQIAKEIIISTNTAKAHVGNILTKLSAKDRVQAAVKAVRANIF